MIVFQNPGVIDPRSITTFGTSSKDNASTAIGYFGTGLKYAIAVLLREGCHVEIHSGGVTYEFSVRKERIRNDDFSIVYMNGQPLGFTTELGKDWKLWQAYRELYCNAKDENGHVHCAPTQAPRDPEREMTHIFVHGPKFEEVHAQRSQYFLNERDTQPLWVGAQVEIYPGESDSLYYRGVRVQELPRKSQFTYNIVQKISLTEDRTISNPYYAQLLVRDTLQMCGRGEIVSDVITANDHWYENELAFSGGSVSSAEFLSAARRLMQEFHPTLNPSVRKLLIQTGLDLLAGAEPYRLDDIDQIRLDTAISFCKEIGFDVSRYPIHVSVFLGEGVLGCAHKETIYLSERVFEQGTKMVAGTLIEEFLHLSTGCSDCTRTMQNILIDKIVSVGERLTRRPL